MGSGNERLLDTVSKGMYLKTDQTLTEIIVLESLKIQVMI